MRLTEADRARLKALTEAAVHGDDLDADRLNAEYYAALGPGVILAMLRDVAVLKKLREWLVMYIACAQESGDGRSDTRYFHDGRVAAFMATMEELDRLTAQAQEQP